MRPHALRSIVTVCSLAFACVALASPNAGAAPRSHSHNPFRPHALLSNTFPPVPPTVLGRVDLQVATHTVAAVVTLTNGLAPGDYDVNAVSSNIEDIFTPRVKRICTATVDTTGTGTCANKVHSNVLSRAVDIAAINVTPAGGDINAPVAVALLRFNR
jgi:hypothetical protein